MRDSSEGVGGQGRTREERLDAIAAIVKECRGYNHGNPRYFAEMFVSTMCCNTPQEDIVLTELELTVSRIRLRQQLQYAEMLAEYAEELRK